MLSVELETMERAEDLFLAYGVPFDPRILSIHRLAILRRFGLRLARVGTTPEDADQRRRLSEGVRKVPEVGRKARDDVPEKDERGLSPSPSGRGQGEGNELTLTPTPLPRWGEGKCAVPGPGIEVRDGFSDALIAEALAEAHDFFANGGRQERPVPREKLITLRVR